MTTNNLVSSAFQITCENCSKIKGPKGAMVDYIFDESEKSPKIVGLRCPVCEKTWGIISND